MPPARVVEEQSRARNRPVREDSDQLSLGQKLTHAILLKVIGNTEPVQRSSNADVSMIGDDGAVHRYFESLPSFLELPAIVPTVHLQAPVDARMVVQIGWRLRYASTREVVRRRHGNHVQVGREADGNHVLLELSTDADACVKAADDDVSQRVVDHDVENHIRVYLMEA